MAGRDLEVLGVWSGVEQRRFEAVLRTFGSQSGASVRYTSAGDRGVPVVLTERLSRGDPPDVALLPQPGLLRRLAARGQLARPSADVGAEVRRNYAPVWRRLGSFDGRVYGVWFKAANKSLVWYDVGAFESAGVVPPTDLRGLREVGRTLTAAGVVPYAVSARDGWTLTDWFEDLYLSLAGPHRYARLADRRVPWTDPSVEEALREMAAILTPASMLGGVDGALRTGFEESVELTFGSRAAAAMVHEADFVAGVITSRTTAELGVDADVFGFPAAGRAAPGVVAGGDVAVILEASAAADALLHYLASPQAAAVWAARGGFVSPNLNLDLTVYPDDLARSVARNLLDAGNGFRFDLSDLQPPSFGGQEDTGMQQELRDFLVHRDVARAAARLERAAAAAYAGDELGTLALSGTG
ncbi:MAG TPA: extracellular solute-binding protein [Actinomycetes bacterium]|nr:extracellular solute-binding protein [Actinomycetes bacterium]